MNPKTVKEPTPLSTSNSASACCESTCCAAVEEETARDHLEHRVDAVPLETHRIRAVVREYYAQRALTGTSCCSSGGGCGSAADPDRIAAAVGYSEAERRAVPEGANLGLGCGNPTAIEDLPVGARVLDLGSGAGFDCLLAARRVGPTGHVIGVDMTPEMIELARKNAAEAGFGHVAFRLGEIEHLPVESGSVDVVLSNCVINLSPDKPQVFAEAFRVLKPGGRLVVSDLVRSGELPAPLRQSAEAYAGCIGGAEHQDRYLALIEAAGFRDVRVVGAEHYLYAAAGVPIVSLRVTATKGE